MRFDCLNSGSIRKAIMPFRGEFPLTLFGARISRAGALSGDVGMATSSETKSSRLECRNTALIVGGSWFGPRATQTHSFNWQTNENADENNRIQAYRQADRKHLLRQVWKNRSRRKATRREARMETLDRMGRRARFVLLDRQGHWSACAQPNHSRRLHAGSWSDSWADCGPLGAAGTWRDRMATWIHHGGISRQGQHRNLASVIYVHRVGPSVGGTRKLGGRRPNSGGSVGCTPRKTGDRREE